MTRRPAKLVSSSTGGATREHAFVDTIEIGRAAPGESSAPGRIAFHDPRISARHCVVSQSTDGRFFVRDLSRNGTRVDGKRLQPNVPVRVRPGQAIQVGDHVLHLLADDVDASTVVIPHDGTVLAGPTTVTVLVGDIRGYTTLSQRERPDDVSRAVRAVEEAGGTLKEYQGDAMFAFWEESGGQRGQHAVDGCAAALALRDRVASLAGDPRVWSFSDSPLGMDWAVVSGSVVISSIGVGLSMVGDAVNLAFRLEKFATDETGPIIVSRATRELVDTAFEFRDLGEVTVKGRSGSERIFALLGRRQVASG